MDTNAYLYMMAAYFNRTGASCYVETEDVPVPMLYMPMEISPLDEEEEPIPVMMTAFFSYPPESFFAQMELQLFRISFYLMKVKEPERLDRLRQLFALFNASLPLGAYEADGEGAIYYAAGLPIPNEMSEALFARQITGAYSVMRLYQGCIAPACKKAAEGKLGVEEAFAEIGETVTLLHAALRAQLEQKNDGTQQ